MSDSASIEDAAARLAENPRVRLVNSACPGFMVTDIGGPIAATKPISDGSAGIVWLATLPDHRPIGDFFSDGRAIAH